MLGLMLLEERFLGGMVLLTLEKQEAPQLISGLNRSRNISTEEKIWQRANSLCAVIRKQTQSIAHASMRIKATHSAGFVPDPDCSVGALGLVLSYTHITVGKHSIGVK